VLLPAYTDKLQEKQKAHEMALLAQADLDLRGARDLPPDVVLEVLVARLARLGPPAWVVTSAGIALPGRFLDQPLAEHEAPDELKTLLRQRLQQLADHMRNQPE
jgi:hypothetical protein